MHHFARNNCTYAIIETGLGGRLDATNVITPLISIITNISLDHQNFLGNTIKAIATEKAGIIKNKVPVFVAEESSITKEIFVDAANLKNTQVTFLTPSQKAYQQLASYQQTNLQTALQAIAIIDIHPTEHEITSAITKLYQNTGLFGRFQEINSSPRIIIDASHNEGGIKILLKELQQTPDDKLKFIVGSSGDKDLKKLIANLPITSEINLCVFKNVRSTTYDELSKMAVGNSAIRKVYKEVNHSLNEIISYTLPDETIVICGSFFLISDINLASFS